MNIVEGAEFSIKSKNGEWEKIGKVGKAHRITIEEIKKEMNRMKSIGEWGCCVGVCKLGELLEELTNETN